MAAADVDLRERVERVIDSVRPYIEGDGGGIDLVGIDADGTVRVRLKGACVGCPASAMTLHMGLERALKQQVPEVTGIVNEA